MGGGFLYVIMKIFWNKIVGINTKLYQETRRPWILYFKREFIYVNYILIKLLPKKTENHARGSRPPGRLGGHWESSRSEHFGIRFQKWGQIDSLNWIRIQLVNFPWATLCGLLSSKDPTCHAFSSGWPSRSGKNWSQGWQSTRCKTNSINGSIPKSEINTVDLEVCKQ